MKNRILVSLSCILLACLAINVAAQTGNTRLGTFALANNTTGDYNTGIGYYSLRSNTSGSYNTGTGAFTLRSNTSGIYNKADGYAALYHNTTGSYNTGLGAWALYRNTTAFYNTAVGYRSLFSSTGGTYNTATGYQSLYTSTTGDYNAANGAQALFSNTSGSHNKAGGYRSLYSNTTGNFNTAGGSYSLYSNSTGAYNTSEGYRSLFNNTTGSYNKAGGVYALYHNTTGWYNKADGAYALYNNTTGYGNTGIGYRALYYNTTSHYNTAVGYSAGGYNYTYSAATFLGSFTRPTVAGLTNITAVGYGALNTASNQVRVGNSSVSSIGGYANWTNISDSRFKKNIKANVPGLSFITKLNPITYTLDVDKIDQALKGSEAELGGSDGQGVKGQPTAEELKAKQEKAKVVYTGSLAQEVKEVADKLNYDFSGVDVPKDSKGFYGIRYAEFVIPLVKAVQELNEKDKEIDDLKTQVAELRQMVLDIKNGSPGLITSISGYLEQNTPNPVTTTTTIRYQIPESAYSARLILTNAKGQLLRTIALTGKQGQVTLDGSTLPVGTYNYSLWVDGKQSTTRRLIVAR